MRIITNTSITKVESVGKGDKLITYLSNGREESIKASQIIVAAGRQGITANLGLENIGIVTYERRYLTVIETLRTKIDTVFAAGDVIGDFQFVYTAAYEGKLAAKNAYRKSKAITNYSVLPWVIFTDPQVAGVGLDENQAKAKGIDAEYLPVLL